MEAACANQGVSGEGGRTGWQRPAGERAVLRAQVAEEVLVGEPVPGDGLDALLGRQACAMTVDVLVEPGTERPELPARYLVPERRERTLRGPHQRRRVQVAERVG